MGLNYKYKRNITKEACSVGMGRKTFAYFRWKMMEVTGDHIGNRKEKETKGLRQNYRDRCTARNINYRFKFINQ